MTETVWKYLEMIWDEDHHGGDISMARMVINELWPDLEGAATELVEAYVEVTVACEDDEERDALVSASEGYRVGGLPFHLPAMRQVLIAGLQAIGSPVIELLREWFMDSEDVIQKAAIAILLAEFGEAAADCVSLLVAEVANSANSKERFTLRCSAAYALGKLGIASAEAVEALAQVAGTSSEAQPLRSYCIEALMDLGPPAAAAIPMLEQILKNEAEDEDLRNFAWSALRSIAASSREHPCGGTVAEHMRSLYRRE